MGRRRRRRLCFWLFHAISIYGYPLPIPYIFHIYFLNMSHTCSLVCFLIYSVNRKQVLHPIALIRKLQSWAWVKNFLIIWVGFLSQFLISYGFLRRILAMHTQVVSVSQHAGWFGAPCCRSTLPDQFFPRIFHDFQRISADFPWISMGFPWIFDGCPWILKDFRGFSMEFPWISADFPLISIDFPWIFDGFPRIL